MGSGKSSVGYSLSKYLNNTFYDLDKEVEKRFNLSIKDIFSEYGEELFREEEKKLLKKEKRKSAKMDAFIRPPCIEKEECDLEEFEEDINNIFLEICNNDIDYCEPLSTKLLDDYKRFSSSSNEDSLIKYIINKLNEYTLGQLLCIYEYKTLFEASFSDINPFDQYGVELGKQIFKNL